MNKQASIEKCEIIKNFSLVNNLKSYFIEFRNFISLNCAIIEYIYRLFFLL